MSDTIEHSSLVIRMLDLFHFDHLRLLQNLDRIEAMIVFRLHQMDTTETTST